MWNIISTSLNILLGLSTFYFYLENCKLKGFEAERDIDLKKVEIEELKRNFEKEKESLNNRWLASNWGYAEGEKSIKKDEYEFLKKDLDEEYQSAKVKLETEVQYLEKLQDHLSKKILWFTQ